MNNFYEEAYNKVGSGDFDKKNTVVIGSNHRSKGISSLAIQRPSDSYTNAVNAINASTKTPVVGYTFVNKHGKKLSASVYQFNKMEHYLTEEAGITDIRPIYADNMNNEQATRWATAGSYEQNFSKLLGGLNNEQY